jgi:tRNA(fMet)-specific endonuclease VapC
MMRYLLDTNAVGDWINKRFGVDTRANEARQRGAIIGTCEIVVAELYFGLEKSTSRDTNIDRLERALSGLKCWPLTREASQEFGRLMAHLSRVGLTIGRMDVLIAAIARTLPDCVVVTNDGDLSRVPGLVIEDWRTEPPPKA